MTTLTYLEVEFDEVSKFHTLWYTAYDYHKILGFSIGYVCKDTYYDIINYLFSNTNHCEYTHVRSINIRYSNNFLYVFGMTGNNSRKLLTTKDYSLRYPSRTTWLETKDTFFTNSTVTHI